MVWFAASEEEDLALTANIGFHGFTLVKETSSRLFLTTG